MIMVWLNGNSVVNILDSSLFFNYLIVSYLVLLKKLLLSTPLYNFKIYKS